MADAPGAVTRHLRMDAAMSRRSHAPPLSRPAAAPSNHPVSGFRFPFEFMYCGRVEHPCSTAADQGWSALPKAKSFQVTGDGHGSLEFRRQPQDPEADGRRLNGRPPNGRCPGGRHPSPENGCSYVVTRSRPYLSQPPEMCRANPSSPRCSPQRSPRCSPLIFAPLHRP